MDLQKLILNERAPKCWFVRQRSIDPSVIILRETVLARVLMRSSSATKYAMKDAKISSKKWLHSALSSGAPVNTVSGAASRKTSMLYIMSIEVVALSGF